MPDKDELKNVGTRAFWTFLMTFLGVFSVADLSTAKTALAAGIASVLSVAKTFVATKVGSYDSTIVANEG